jgi:hypothetical protein
VAGIQIAAFFAIPIPLLIAGGLRGFALGWLIANLIALAARAFFLARLFSGFRMTRHLVRAIAPSVPAVAVVLLVRPVWAGHRTAGMAIAELAIYAAVTAAATIALERDLLREVLGYLRGPRVGPATADQSA